MDKSIKSLAKERRRKKKTVRNGKISKRGLGSFQNLGLGEVVCKRKARKVKKIAECYLNSFIQSIYDGRISLPRTEEKSRFQQGNCKGNLLDDTVNLCPADSSVENSNSSVVLISSTEREPNNDTVIDLSEDLSEKSEVIDLTKQVSTSQSVVKAVEHRTICEPALIDISDDEFMEEPNCKPENDEIFVIGTFNNTCRFNNLINCSDKLKRKYIHKQSVLDKIDDQNLNQKKRKCHKSKKNSHLYKAAKVGENVYVNSPLTLPSHGLRPIIIDGSNVAFVHSNSNFCCKRLEICISYFKEKGHKVTAFVPQFRVNSHRSDDPQLLRKLERQGDVILTPSKKIDGKNIVPYDDRFIVQTAVLKGGIIVTRDNYSDLLRENPAWAETIKYRTLAFTWVDDMLMFPKDPLGEHGPSLEEFLRFH